MFDVQSARRLTAWIFCLLAVVLAGCATGPKENTAQAPAGTRTRGRPPGASRSIEPTG